MSNIFGGMLSGEERSRVIISPIKEEDEFPKELRQRFEHLRRVTRKQSSLRMRNHTGNNLFAHLYSQFQQFYSRDQFQSLEKCFLMADHDKDGHLNDIELKYWMEKHNRPISHRDLKHILSIADLDNDGALSFKEFLLLCQKMELSDSGAGHSGINSIYNCFEEDTLQDIQIRQTTDMNKSKSFINLHAQIDSNVKYFENQISDELEREGRGGSTDQHQQFNRKRNEEYEKRIQEIKTNSGFDLHEFSKDIKHPAEEVKEICAPEIHKLNPTSKKEEIIQRRYKTELYIVPENNSTAVAVAEQSQIALSLVKLVSSSNASVNNPSVPPPTNSVSCFESSDNDDTFILLPVNPSSSHKFETDLHQINQQGEDEKIQNEPPLNRTSSELSKTSKQLAQTILLQEYEDRSRKPRKQGRPTINKSIKNKVNLVFDPNARRKFLTGFRKRKAERKVQYQEKLEKDLAEEKRKMREEAKKSISKKQSSSHSILPEVEHLLADDDDDSSDSDDEFQVTYDLGSTTVNICSLDDAVHPKLEVLKEEEKSDLEEDELLHGERDFLTYKRRSDFATGSIQTSDNAISAKLRRLFKPSVGAGEAAKTETLVKKETNRLLMKSDVYKKALKFKQQNSKKFKLNRYQPGTRGGKKNDDTTTAAPLKESKSSAGGGTGKGSKKKGQKTKIKTK